MKKTFTSTDIACQSCANLIKASLEEKYNQIDINLEVNPREVRVELDSEEQENAFKEDMKELGFELLEG